MDEADRLTLLTDAEKEVLRLFLTSSDVKEMARTIGISAAAVEQRLHRARRKLAVKRSLDAAHILAAAEGHPVIRRAPYSPSYVAQAGGEAGRVAPSEGGVDIWRSLLPTKGRPWNDLPVWARLAWILAATLAATIAALVSVSLGGRCCPGSLGKALPGTRS